MNKKIQWGCKKHIPGQAVRIKYKKYKILREMDERCANAAA